MQVREWGVNALCLVRGPAAAQLCVHAHGARACAPAYACVCTARHPASLVVIPPEWPGRGPLGLPPPPPPRAALPTCCCCWQADTAECARLANSDRHWRDATRVAPPPPAPPPVLPGCAPPRPQLPPRHAAVAAAACAVAYAHVGAAVHGSRLQGAASGVAAAAIVLSICVAFDMRARRMYQAAGAPASSSSSSSPARSMQQQRQAGPMGLGAPAHAMDGKASKAQ